MAASQVSGQATDETAFIERFALFNDRDNTLMMLPPQSEEYYYFKCLSLEKHLSLNILRDTVSEWERHFPDSERLATIRNRVALLSYPSNPQSTIEFLTRGLAVDLGHQQPSKERSPDIESRLRPAQYAPEIFYEKLFENHPGSISAAAGREILQRRVNVPAKLNRMLLAALERPDVAGIVDLVIAELRDPQSRGFGEFPIHRRLLPAQLDALAQQLPQVAASPAFVETRLSHLLPSADVDVEFNPTERGSWLARAWDYVAGLPPAFNSLKLQVYSVRLRFDREQGVWDRARFIEYLKLPRRDAFVAREVVEKDINARFIADPTRPMFPSLTALPPVGDDAFLIRDYLLRLLRDEPRWEPWAAWLQESFVKALFAEAKLTAGIGHPADWAPLLSPAQFQQLKDRVEVTLEPNNPAFIRPADSVTVAVATKNVPRLTVKVYELNPLSYFLTSKRQLNTDLNVDGLVATQEKTHELASEGTPIDPLRRKTSTFDFPELKGRRGAWLIEFIGAGRSSRALIRKGEWHVVSQPGPAGPVLTVFDESGQHIRDVVAWLEGRRFSADPATGLISVPFGEEPNPRRAVVLAEREGAFASLGAFADPGESYRLEEAIHLSHEQLIAGREATVAVRSRLLVGDRPLALGLLKNVRLSIKTRTADGTDSAYEFTDLDLTALAALTRSFIVPPRLSSVSVKLTGEVGRLSGQGNPEKLHAERAFVVNGFNASAQLTDVHLLRSPGGYALDTVGRNGEPVANQLVTVRLTRRHFDQPVETVLGSDKQGRIHLGALAGLQTVEASVHEGVTRRWSLDVAGSQAPLTLHLRSGEILRIPWPATEEPLTRESASLLETQTAGNELRFVADRFSALTLDGASLTARDLPPGDYSLDLPSQGKTFVIRVSAAPQVNGWLASPYRHLERRSTAPVLIESTHADENGLTVRVRNATIGTRVHVVATRFVPGQHQLAELGTMTPFSPSALQAARRPNLYASGRSIGDEFRYILERREVRRFPGNQLSRPGLLLNPWETRSTPVEAVATAGAEPQQRGAGDRERRELSTAATALAKTQEGMIEPDLSPSLEFLRTPAPAALNLTPDAEGRVRLDLAVFGDRHHLQILAEDAETSAWRQVVLPEKPLSTQDLRLARPLDPAKNFAERKTATVLRPGESISLADPESAQLETYDTLGSAFALLRTLQPEPDLERFAFLVRWQALTPEEKRSKYSEFACHEINLFLSRKDPVFFTEVVQPYLRNKKDRTFMDDYLLGADLLTYVEPWRYHRLNVVERCLLAQRVPARRAATVRHLREVWELIPTDPANADRLFDTALLGRALDDQPRVKLQAQPETMSADRLAAFADQAPENASPPAVATAPVAPLPKSVMPARRAQSAPSGEMEHDAVDKKSAELRFSLAEAQAMRQAARPYFQKLGPTREWAENNYFRQPIEAQVGELVMVSEFWRDFAAWDEKDGPFLSGHLPEAARSKTEVLLALAVIDLPFVAGKHLENKEAGRFALTAGSPLIVFHRQIKPAAAVAGGGLNVPVSEHYFRLDDPQVGLGTEPAERYVTDEFLTRVVYGGRVVVSNPRAVAQKLSVLLQVPEGAIPVRGSRMTESRRLRLEPYATAALEYFFYFPEPAIRPFSHYPAHVSLDDGQSVGHASQQAFRVVKDPTKEDSTSWSYVAALGTEAQVFEFLEKANLARTDLEPIAWRVRKSASFFRRLIRYLQDHQIWSEPIFRYGLLHNDEAAIREWLRHQDQFIQRCGPALDSALLRIDPVERHTYQHLEYSPLVNQRIHRIGSGRRIANPVLRKQYLNLLNVLAHRANLTAEDQLEVVYYLLLQDRVEEALLRLGRINPGELQTRVQYDYMRCYLALSEEQPSKAREIATAYQKYPVDRWRQLFGEVLSQIEEIDGRIAKRAPTATIPQAELSATEPVFDFKVEDRSISLQYRNLSEVTVNYYLMDPELLFSASPFSSGDLTRFSIVKPTRQEVKQLAAGTSQLSFPLPDAFGKSNVLIEILGAGQRKALAYHANRFHLVLTENYGRLELRHEESGRPIPKAYVKVYAKMRGGGIRFLKDGYTDLRGRFDYASLNSSDAPMTPPVALARDSAAGGELDHPMLAPAEIDSIERLSVLVLSDDAGAAVREVAPPSQ